MVDPADALENLVTRHAERGQIQRDWIVASAECDRQAREALAKAAEALTENIPAGAETPSWRGPGLRSARGGLLSRVRRRPGVPRLRRSRWIKEA